MAARENEPWSAEAAQHAMPHGLAWADGRIAEAMVDPDFVGLRHDGAWLDRAAFLAEAPQRPRVPIGPRATVRRIGDVAIVHGLNGANGDGGRVCRSTDVFARCDAGRWRWVSAQDTPLAPTAPLEIVRGAEPAHAPWAAQDPQADDDEARLVALNDHYVRAFRDADVPWYAAHLRDDFLVVQGDGSLHDRAAALQRFARPTFADTMASFPVGSVRVRRFGDTALIHAENDYRLRDGRRGLSRYTDTWQRVGPRWLCIAAHITPCAAPG